MQESEEAQISTSTDTNVIHGEIETRARDDMNYLAGLAAPDEVDSFYPPFYLFLWHTITKVLFKARDFSKYAIALPRGHGKTFVVKLLVLYVILFTKRRYVMIIGAKQEHAVNIIQDVCNMLDHPNMRKVFGDWDADIETNSALLKKFKFRGRKIILKPEGANTALRGSNIDNARPDVMIFDDAQSKDVAQSPEQALKFISWFQGTALKAKDPKKCTFLYVGNMYPNVVIREDAMTGKKIYGCHLRNLKDDPSWTSLVIGGILADGKALWEALQPLEQLLSEFESDAAMGMPEVFFAEVMNDPDAQINSDFDFEKVPMNPFETNGVDLFEPEGKFLVIDPSLGKKKQGKQRGSDLQIVAEFWVIDGKPIYRRILPKELTQVSSPELVRNVINYCLSEKIPLVVSETYAYQETLLQWFNFISSQIGVEGITFRGISRGMRAKNQSIMDWFKVLVQTDKPNPNLMYLHSDIRSRLFDRIRVWDKLEENNRDDELDVGYYGMRICGDSELLHLTSIIDGAQEVSSGNLITGTGNYV